MHKICYFINTDWYFDLHWLERALSARDNGYEVNIICNFDNEIIYEKFKGLGLKCYKLNVHSQSLNVIRFTKSVCKFFAIMKSISPDILHCITIKPIIIGGLYSFLRKKPVVLSIVGLGRLFDGNTPFLKILKYFITKVYKLFFKNPKALFIFEHNSDRDKLLTLTHGSIHQTAVIDGAGVNTDQFCYQPEPLNEVPIILFASRLIWSKGLYDLIQAKVKLKDQDVNFRILVAGIAVTDDKDAIQDSVMQKWVENGWIEWLGMSEDVAQLIGGANLVVLPSVYNEGIPRILLESCAIGRACICYDSGGCGSLVIDGENGFLVTKHDVDSLAERISYLLQYPLARKKMGRRGTEIVSKKFSSEIIIASTLAVYKKLI
ncbi:glycosyltransferase family 4 protein [Erwinia pyrifoliae]|uniref:glycosyltransferase family 4 protein n=1 Tax=Erwinia pyrifoliae TaxID=79967 RepID=UPI0001960D40|nr:glycosyltransferase family 4 protein [Erwinia pyrifoliae]AUX73081.1 glycosyltransferase family 1 protein [Erwinia pyrifoliae]MCA8876638.1 glycosyltransferase family 4 protein [Erwinia pyrifoliae]MCT2386753.1 glycosyltransferase family 4 protein [Erwinia pyrifoliae]MCU8587649.1 glycosyltransferase family 4 protein [Erwinia pyrifoliae]UWS31447.1 glycosyltransferase family 4 protein [Erwinia pyrifoliae]